MVIFFENFLRSNRRTNRMSSRPQAPAWGRIFLRQAPLGDRYLPLYHPRRIKAELCTKTGSQAGAWEPEKAFK